MHTLTVCLGGGMRNGIFEQLLTVRKKSVLSDYQNEETDALMLWIYLIGGSLISIGVVVVVLVARSHGFS